jgi:hypothetical protein
VSPAFGARLASFRRLRQAYWCDTSATCGEFLALREGVAIARADDPGARLEGAGERVTGSHDETKWAPLTTEFWAMLVLIIVILIAAAISDSLGDVRAWTLVTVIGAAYIVSRGFARGGTDHAPS